MECRAHSDEVHDDLIESVVPMTSKLIAIWPSRDDRRRYSESVTRPVFYVVRKIDIETSNLNLELYKVLAVLLKSKDKNLHNMYIMTI